MKTTNRPCKPRNPVGISSYGFYLPKNRLVNSDLIRLGCPVTDEWIVEKTGIKCRAIAEDDEAMSDLLLPAMKMALSGLKPNSEVIDAIIASGDLHDSGGVQLTSALVANHLNLNGSICIDLRVGCPSSVFALHNGLALIASGLAGRALIGAGEVNSRGADFTDRTSVWFGDGAGAVILESCAPDTGILASYIAGSGEGSEILIVPAGGSREPITNESLTNGRNRLFMDGKAVFPFAVEKMVKTIGLLTDSLQLSPSDLNWIIPHQANIRIIEAGMQKLNLPLEKAIINIDRYGNTAGASVLLTLSEAVLSGKVHSGDLVVTVGFGGGLAWGGQIIRINSFKDFKKFQ